MGGGRKEAEKDLAINWQLLKTIPHFKKEIICV